MELRKNEKGEPLISRAFSYTSGSQVLGNRRISSMPVRPLPPPEPASSARAASPSFPVSVSLFPAGACCAFNFEETKLSLNKINCGKTISKKKKQRQFIGTIFTGED